MNSHSDILEKFLSGDYLFVESLIGLKTHKEKLRIEHQLNYLNIIDNVKNPDNVTDFFFKMYVYDRENDKWEFIDYGYLKIFKLDDCIRAVFCGLESKISLFNSDNLAFELSRHNTSDRHLIITTATGLYLLETGYYQLVDFLIKQIF